MKELIIYKYVFFCEKMQKEFVVNIDSSNLQLIEHAEMDKPDWAKLDKFKCPNCPLNIEEHEYCPLALQIQDVLLFFKEVPSYQKVNIKVIASARTYEKETDVQTGVSSLMGLIMPTSGCPILGKLKPLVKFHLPFANIEETEFKVFSMYLLAQYFKMKNGKTPDWEMKNLNQIYEDISILNRNVAEKITQVENMDAGINAVVVLNNFADSVTFGLDTADLSHIEKLFEELI